MQTAEAGCDLLKTWPCIASFSISRDEAQGNLRTKSMIRAQGDLLAVNSALFSFCDLEKLFFFCSCLTRIYRHFHLFVCLNFSSFNRSHLRYCLKMVMYRLSIEFLTFSLLSEWSLLCARYQSIFLCIRLLPIFRID